jgi:hypothetical protein
MPAAAINFILSSYQSHNYEDDRKDQENIQQGPPDSGTHPGKAPCPKHIRDQRHNEKNDRQPEQTPRHRLGQQRKARKFGLHNSISFQNNLPDWQWCKDYSSPMDEKTVFGIQVMKNDRQDR